MERIVHAVINTLAKELGASLENAYLYGSLAQRTYEMGDSDINLLLVVSEDLPIHKLRASFWPLWQEYRRRLLRAPLVATPRTLARHLLLHPALRDHLADSGQVVHGVGDVLANLPPLPASTPEETYAYLAHQALLASAALAPDRRSTAEQAVNQRRLRSLARRIFGQPVSSQETAVTTFARIQEHLAPLINSLPNLPPWESTRIATSPMVPGLQATYVKDLENLILVFNQLTAKQLSSIGWSKLAERLAKEYNVIFVTSSVQLRLINQYETPMDLFFKRTKHTWGEDPLRDLQASTYYKLRQAARRPSAILLDSLPNAYLTTPSQEMGTVVHDFQNKMLNVQLESELLKRLGVVDFGAPPTPLPGRETPLPERITAIMRHLDWWAGHYTTAMRQAATPVQTG